MALLWAAGIIWMAVDVAGPPDAPTNNAAAADRPTDVTGATISDDDLKKFADFANGK